MFIRDILNTKGNLVETIWPERTLADALVRLDERNISSLVVTDHHGHPIGIVSDRDAVRAIVRHGPVALRHPVSALMQSPPPTCWAEDSVTRLMHRMTFDRLRHVLVVEGERLIGIVSVGDLLKSRLQDADLENRVLRERALGRLAADLG